MRGMKLRQSARQARRRSPCRGGRTRRLSPSASSRAMTSGGSGPWPAKTAVASELPPGDLQCVGQYSKTLVLDVPTSGQHVRLTRDALNRRHGSTVRRNEAHGRVDLSLVAVGSSCTSQCDPRRPSHDPTVGYTAHGSQDRPYRPADRDQSSCLVGSCRSRPLPRPHTVHGHRIGALSVPVDRRLAELSPAATAAMIPCASAADVGSTTEAIHPLDDMLNSCIFRTAATIEGSFQRPLPRRPSGRNLL